jgi:hypothetical protein
MHVSASGHAKRLVDIAGYELSANPGGGHIDSNPFGLLALPGHRLVNDAGGNSLLDVAANGSVSTVATFPQIPARSACVTSCQPTWSSGPTAPTTSRR